MTKQWWKAAGIRALRTMAQTAAGILGTGVLLSDIDFIALLSASGLAGLLSLVMSVAGLPEVDE